MWEVLSSNLGQETGYPEVSLGFLKFLLANAMLIPQSGHDHFLPNPFLFILHPTI
jgi:hypothetical protein